MNWQMMTFVGLLCAFVGCSGCDVVGTSGNSKLGADGTKTSPSTTLGNEYLLTTEPTDAIAVGTARQTVTDTQEITLIGIIGGSTSPFVEGIAAFTIVDSKVQYCAAEEGCKTPWDYCCTQNQVKDNIATVKIVDATGNPVAIDAKALLNIKELSTVLVQGTAKRDDAGNLSIAASKIFVKKR